MIGEAELVSIAAAAAGTTATELLERTDMGALARVAAAAEVDAGTLEHAARLLLAIAQERPFPDGSNLAAAWLTAAFVLEEAGVRHRVRAADAVPFVAGLDERSALGDVMVTLERIVARNGPRMAWFCPVCGRELYARERREGRLINVGITAFELTNRCWYEHREHDRRGRPFRSAAADPVPVAVS